MGIRPWDMPIYGHMAMGHMTSLASEEGSGPGSVAVSVSVAGLGLELGTGLGTGLGLGLGLGLGTVSVSMSGLGLGTAFQKLVPGPDLVLRAGPGLGCRVKGL